jgi:predicted O-methyltransferase YrrM
MQQDQWNAVDQYICDLMVPPDAALDACLRASVAAGLPAINVAPNQGKFLQLLARMQGAKKILEVGTLGGYSTLWLARALPAGGKLVTLEFEPKHAEVAKKNIAYAGLSDRIEIHVGPAIKSLPTLVNQAPFDFVFIDADKISTLDYFQWALKLTKTGSVIIVDNVVRDGNIIDPNSDDEGVHGVRKFNEFLAKEKRVTATAIQTVGSKGYDGFCMAIVVADTGVAASATP